MVDFKSSTGTLAISHVDRRYSRGRRPPIRSGGAGVLEEQWSPTPLAWPCLDRVAQRQSVAPRCMYSATVRPALFRNHFVARLGRLGIAAAKLLRPAPAGQVPGPRPARPRIAAGSQLLSPAAGRWRDIARLGVPKSRPGLRIALRGRKAGVFETRGGGVRSDYLTRLHVTSAVPPIDAGSVHLNSSVAKELTFRF